MHMKRDHHVCVKHLFQETTNVTRYSWFERSNLVPYEPGMRRRVVDRRSPWQSARKLPSDTNSPPKSRDTSPEGSATNQEEIPHNRESTADTVAQENQNTDQNANTEEGRSAADSSVSAQSAIIVVEHRWSFLLPRRSPPAHPHAPGSQQGWFDKTVLQSETQKKEQSAEAEPMAPLSSNIGNAEDKTDNSNERGKMTLMNISDAFRADEFGGRSSILRCLMLNLETRYVSRTQMNYSFHLSAISERVILDGVYYIANPWHTWNPLICNEPIDIKCSIRLYDVLKDAMESGRLYKDSLTEQRDAKRRNVNDGSDAVASELRSGVHDQSSVGGHMNTTPSAGERSPLSYPLSDLSYVSSGTAVLDQLDHKFLSSMFSFLIRYNADLTSGSLETRTEEASALSKEKLKRKILRILHTLGGDGCFNGLITAVLVCIIRGIEKDPLSSCFEDPRDSHYKSMTDSGIIISIKMRPFERLRASANKDMNLPYVQNVGNAYRNGIRLCLCSSKYALCPTVYNEYVIFGGSPATVSDMELGVWIFDSPFTRVKMRDVPVIYHQQIQYSTKKYITMLDAKDATLSARVLNLRMEFCNRGDWIFDDGSLPPLEGEKDKPVYGKILTIDDLMQVEFTGTLNQISKKFFMLQKASLTTGKEGTSRLIFMEPYANIDAGVCEDKDYSEKLVGLLSELHKYSPDSFLASCNGYYYHEDGFVPESIEVQRLRNQLFCIESSHHRTAMLADIIQDQKTQLNSAQKMPFLTKCKRVVIGKSRIHGFGLFAVDTINKGELILEYSGVVISDHMADMRESMYERLLCGSIYMFRLDLHHIIDSTFYGNCARFINHCCDPNTATSNFSYIDEDGFGTHVGIYASKVIPAGEEIYYNYRLSSGSTNKEICYCGSYLCTGYMSLVK